jgi:hypothetical protein
MYWMLLHDVVHLLLVHSICFYPRKHRMLDRALVHEIVLLLTGTHVL